MDKQKQIFVTQPAMPPLEEFIPYLEEIWESKWLTNNGSFHQKLEQALADYLGVKYVSLFCNGMIALETALQAIRITGEVITTPYSFVATTHAIHMTGCTPVFCDIEPDTFNIDVDKIEALITPKTTAIMPVHVYGNPCDMERLQQIADTYGLKVIYDAAHAFGVKKNGESILNFGDISMLSFHATKVFNTIEGGALITNDEKLKKRIDFLKNFGFADEVTVVAPGSNGKMNELQAAFGLLNLKYIDQNIEKRKKIAQLYRHALEGIDGISCLHDLHGVVHNYSYFPILVNKTVYGISRDELYNKFREHGIYARRYFYPLISDFPTYRGLPTSVPSQLKVSDEISKEVLCLPIFPDLDLNTQNKIVSVLSEAKNDK